MELTSVICSIDVFMPNCSNAFFTFKRLAIAAMLIVIIATGSLFSVNYYNANYTSYYTVNIDINPSTKLYINSKDIIYKVEALNDDANKIDINSLKSISLEDGLKQYLTLCKDEELISDGAIVSIDIDFCNANTDVNSILNLADTTVKGYLKTETISWVDVFMMLNLNYILSAEL